MANKETAATFKKTQLKLTPEVSDLIKEKIKIRIAREALPQNKARKEQ